jgi:hypothetical protein
MTEACGAHGRKRNIYKFPVGVPERKTILRRSMSRWEGDTEMGLNGIGMEGMALSFLTPDRDQWRDIVDTPIKINKFRIMLEISCLSDEVLASEEDSAPCD